MSSELTLDFENRQYHHMMMNSDTGNLSIDQDGEWDISLFDELEHLGVASELLGALEHAGYDAEAPDLDLDLDFDIDLTPWNTAGAGSTCTDGEVSVNSLSPAYTLSSVPSPASVEALSPCSLSEEALSPQSQPSPVSVCSDSSGFHEAPPPAKRAPKRTSLAPRAKPAQPVKRPMQLSPKVSIQPKPLITALNLAHATAPLQANTIIIQPLQTTVLPIVKSAPVNIQPAPLTGHRVVLPQSGQVLQIQTTQALPGHLVTLPTLGQERPATVVPAQTIVPVTLRAPSSDDDSKVCQRQQRMIKNRESASLSRKKKKEYLLTLEARLRMALSENEALKNENGHLKKQLDGLLTKNMVLKTTAPKRRAVCLMVVLVFLMINIGPMSVFQGGPGSKIQAGSMQPGVRHLLGVSPEAEADVGPEPSDRVPSESTDRFEDKALMVVKDLSFLRTAPACQPPVNRTKCIKLVHELRGWVHRHEVEQTKSRRLSNSQQKPTRTILKTTDKDNGVNQIVTVRYTENTEEKNSGSELQVYYAPHRTYSDFFDEINRRGDTFYVVSFRRDHLLLPATSHNKGSRPKMSLVLPAMNINESVIKDKDEFEVMMQIDCEVTDTRILHVRSSTIPPLLRVNNTDTLYQAPPSARPVEVTPPVGVLMGSA
ncbi:Cyclic AMP-dependent transcription factor ATF-6 alpha [Merluccius polli]|uniref:Cyclic AMP-dependent transcription factor ATF-6 alpha n=1 Tax=Merluccius polli TaxID=89951 RepID=A0AA47N0I2_MERPO|nr:Cyclic AMP-dependent transcription factor ATF-6 alpha [Merluccius polli]